MIDVSWSPIFLEGDQATTCFFFLRFDKKIKATLTNKSFPKSKTPRQFEEILFFSWGVSEFLSIPSKKNHSPLPNHIIYYIYYIYQTKNPPKNPQKFATQKSTPFETAAVDLPPNHLNHHGDRPDGVGQWQVPVRAGWLYTLVHEAYDPEMAIRGSRFRGRMLGWVKQVGLGHGWFISTWKF